MTKPTVFSLSLPAILFNMQVHPRSAQATPHNPAQEASIAPALRHGIRVAKNA